jgi:hypothetical protein
MLMGVKMQRGDSMDGGGSGQWWLGTKIFDVILKKLVEGCIVLTDSLI